MRPAGHVTTREAARLLGLGREGAARVLASGLAGPPFTCGRATLYETAAVQALRGWPEVDRSWLRRRFPEGLLVGRIDPRRTVPQGPWTVCPVRQVALDLVARRQGPTPLVVTTNGFVLGAYEIVGHTWHGRFLRGKQPRVAFDLGPPGEWAVEVLGHRFSTPPGHPLWTWENPMLPQIRRMDELVYPPQEIRRSRPHAAAG